MRPNPRFQTPDFTFAFYLTRGRKGPPSVGPHPRGFHIALAGRLVTGTPCRAMRRWRTMKDEDLLDRLERAAFGYFLEQMNPSNGLVADTSREGSPSSI